MSFELSWLLCLLPLALLPLWAAPGAALANAWMAGLQRDPASSALSWALRAAAVLALAALVVGMAGPYRPEVPVERVGRGAEIVLVLDRSRSMDQGFAGASVQRPVQLQHGIAALLRRRLRRQAAQRAPGQRERPPPA